MCGVLQRAMQLCMKLFTPVEQQNIYEIYDGGAATKLLTRGGEFWSFLEGMRGRCLKANMVRFV